MHRRTAIHSLAGGIALLGGCLSTPNSAGSTTPTDRGSTTDGGRTLSIDSVDTPTHAPRLNDLGAPPAGSVPELSSRADRKREVLTQAIDGGYETSDPDKRLLNHDPTAHEWLVLHRLPLISRRVSQCSRR